MRHLDMPDVHHLNAATGWTELGNFAEAKEELQKVSPENCGLPEVYQARWRIACEEKDWATSLEIARRFHAEHPTCPESWIELSYALHELGETKKAFDELLPAVDKFPEAGVIPYNLACYACKMGDLIEANRWIEKAMRVLGKKQLKKMALNDPDLAPMKSVIANL